MDDHLSLECPAVDQLQLLLTPPEVIIIAVSDIPNVLSSRYLRGKLLKHLIYSDSLGCYDILY